MYEPLELALCLIVNTVIKLYQFDYSVWYVNKEIWKIEPFFKHIQQKILSSQRFLQTSLIFSLLMRASWYIPKDYSQPVGTWYSPRNHGKTCQHIFLCNEESWLTFFFMGPDGNQKREIISWKQNLKIEIFPLRERELESCSSKIRNEKSSQIHSETFFQK